MDKSIEAAARAMYRYHNLREASNDAWRLYESEARAAIAAYRDAEIADLRAKLEAAERDAERLREEIGDLQGHIADFRGQIESVEKSAMLAYGWLWHAMTSDKRVRIPRAVLRDALSPEQRRAGIQAAKDVGATVDAHDILGVDVVIDAEIAALRAKLEAAERDARRECLWVDDDDCGIWEGSCGVAWTFIDAGPAENGMKHCPQCGGHLTLDEAEREGEQ